MKTEQENQRYEIVEALKKTKNLYVVVFITPICRCKPDTRMTKKVV